MEVFSCFICLQYTETEITCWSDSVWRELLYHCSGLQGVSLYDVFCLLLHRILFSYTHTHTGSHTLSFSFQTHTRTQWLLRCIQAWRRIGFVTHLNWDRGNSALRVLGEAVSLLFPLWGHTMLTEWPTKQHVSVQPLPVSFIHHWNPSVWSEEELLLFYTSAFLVLLSYSYKIPRGA